METVENKTNVENKQNNSLMRKTKAQLIDIILRKDSIERNLRADMKGTQKTHNELKESFDALDKQYNELNRDYRDICDEKISIECALNDKINRLIKFIKLIGLMLFASIGLIMYFVFL